MTSNGVGAVATHTEHREVSVRSSSWRLDMEHKTQEKMKQEWQAAELRKQIEEKRLEKEAVEEQRRRREAQEVVELGHYNPWGRGGAGAPLRDRGGNLRADLRLRFHAPDDAHYLQAVVPTQLMTASETTVMSEMCSIGTPTTMCGGPPSAGEQEAILSLGARTVAFGQASIAGPGIQSSTLTQQHLGASQGPTLLNLTNEVHDKTRDCERPLRQPPSISLSSRRGSAVSRRAPASVQRARAVMTAPEPSSLGMLKEGEHRLRLQSNGKEIPKYCASRSSDSKPLAVSTRREGRAKELEEALHQRDGQIQELRRQIERQQALLMQCTRLGALPPDSLQHLVGSVFPEGECLLFPAQCHFRFCQPLSI